MEHRVKMAFNFDKPADRRNTHCVKWDGIKSRYGREGLLPMWVADMDFETAPAVRHALVQRAEQGIFGYTEMPVSFLELAVEWTDKRYGHPMAVDTLIHSPGVVPSIILILRTLTKPGDAVLIQPPVYPPFAASVRDNGCQLVTNALFNDNGLWQIDYDDFEEKASRKDVKWFLLCNPHNPVGRAWKESELQRMAEICLRHDVRIISDEIWRDLTMPGFSHCPTSRLSPEVESLTITCFSATKSFNLAGLQTSFLSVPRVEERRMLQEALSALHIDWINVMALAAVEAAYKKGQEWLDALTIYLAQNMKLIHEFFESRALNAGFTVPEATYLAWLDFRKLGLESQELHRLMVDQGGIAMNGGTSFGEEGAGFMRLNAACPRGQLQAALNGIELAMRSVHS